MPCFVDHTYDALVLYKAIAMVFSDTYVMFMVEVRGTYCQSGIAVKDRTDTMLESSDLRNLYSLCTFLV